MAANQRNRAGTRGSTRSPALGPCGGDGDKCTGKGTQGTVPAGAFPEGTTRAEPPTGDVVGGASGLVVLG